MQNVSDVMTRGIRTMARDDTLTTAAQAMRELNVGALPVCDGERLVGMVTDRDMVLRGLAEERTHSRLNEVMSREVYYCYEDQPVDEAIASMRDMQVRRLPVVDRNQRLVGMVSLGDVATNVDERQSGTAIRDISSPSEPNRRSQSAASGAAGGGQTS